MTQKQLRYLAWKVAELIRERGYEPNVKVIERDHD
jgi:hypothetical protein